MLHVLLRLKMGGPKVKMCSTFACFVLRAKRDSPHKQYGVMLVGSLRHIIPLWKTSSSDFFSYCLSNMSSTGVKAVASVTRPIKPIDGTRDGHIKRVTLPRERSDTHRWQCHYQYRSKHLILALRYYWVFSLVGIGILYWCTLLWLLRQWP